MQQDPNYGRHEEETVRQGRGADAGLTRVSVGRMSESDERTWSMLAHLSTLLSLVSGIGGPVAAFVIWLVYRERSERVAFHALQSLWYQLAWVGIIVAYFVASLVLSLIVVGVFMFLLLPVIALIPIVHQVFAAIRVNGGEDYRYPIVADWVDGGHRFSGRG
jgi:uncharacterized Tic20 family protein